MYKPDKWGNNVDLHTDSAQYVLLHNWFIPSHLFKLCTTIQQERRRWYYINLWHVRTTIFFLCKSGKWCILWVCICSLRYPTCNAHTGHLRLSKTECSNIIQSCAVKRLTVTVEIHSKIHPLCLSQWVSSLEWSEGPVRCFLKDKIVLYWIG